MNNELFRGKYRISTTRLQHWDYSSNGAYFVTICTKNREEFFGEVKNGIMGLNEMGCAVAKFWQEIPQSFPNAKLDEWQIMPNHLHGILVIDNEMSGDDNKSSVETRHGTSLRNIGLHTNHKKPVFNRFGTLTPKSISSMINHFKGVVTKWCRKNEYQNFTWQPRFYDHIIRNEKDLNRIRKYIQNDPRKWWRNRNNREGLWM